jgi:hypothetical protein
MNSDFKVIIPNYHPEIDKFEYNKFWHGEWEKCIEGKWANGTWMPGPLYQYINYQVIPLEDTEGSQKYGFPILRDIDWDVFYLYEEARGFSGFELDEKYTCNRFFGPDKHKLADEQQRRMLLKHGLILESDFKKEYIDARTYLRRVHSKNLGSPLYINNSKNILLGAARGLGKTLICSAVAWNNFLFGGSKNFKSFMKNRADKSYNTSLTVLSAWEKKWVAQIQSYLLDAFKKAPGKFIDSNNQNKLYPSPMTCAYTGSREIGDDMGLVSPQGSRIISRIFADNPLSTNSGRPNLVVIDEAFFAKALSEFMGAIAGSEASKLKNNLVIFAIGTGGLAKGSSLVYAEESFLNPEKHNFLSVEDKWEGRGKIGYFIPITHTKLTYKDPDNDYNTNEEYALKDQLEKRKELEGNRKELAIYTINNPLYPSELFLLSDDSFFPAAEIKTQLMDLEGGKKKDYLERSYKGWMKLTDTGEVEFEAVQGIKPIRTYPFDGDDIEKKGCIEIWKKPFKDDNGITPRNRYIAGADVVDKAASTTNSLPSVIIYDRLLQEIVCEYTGRTTRPSFFFEQCRRLCLYYNCLLMYEQNLTAMFTHFEQHKSLHWLADTPKSLRNIETFIPGSNTSKGITKAGTRIEENGVNWILDWLNTKISETSDETKVSTIYSPAILKEMLKYQPGEKINVDRLSALIILFTYDNTLQLVKRDKKDSKEVKNFLSSDYFRQRGFLKKKEN